MAETYYSIKLSTLTDIGDAIREKNGTTGAIAVTNLATSIHNLSPALQEKSVTENGEITADEGYDGLSKVTVDVPIPDGYIIPSGTISITENGTYNVTNYANAEVNVEPTLEEITITENGEYLPSEDGYSKVIVNVADSPIPIEISNEADMTALLTSGEVGGVYKYTGETTETYENGSLYMLGASE